MGFGYSIQFPYSIEGTRQIQGGTGTLTSLSDPNEMNSSFSYSFYPIVGVSIQTTNRLNIVFEFGQKWIYNSNLHIYGFPTIEESENQHKSIVFGLSTLYTMN